MSKGTRITVLALAIMLFVVINVVASIGSYQATILTDQTGTTVLRSFALLVLAAGIFASTLKPNIKKFMTKGQKAIILATSILLSLGLFGQSLASYQLADNLSYAYTGYAAVGHASALAWFVLAILVFIGGVVACVIKPKIRGSSVESQPAAPTGEV